MSNLLHSIVALKKRPIVYVHPDVSVWQCVEIMVRDDIGALVVTDDINTLGIVSERDVVRGLVNKNLSAESTSVADIFKANITILSPMDTVETAMEKMTVTKRRHVLVAEGDRLIAIVSIGDILLNLLEDKTQVIEHLEHYIHN